MCVCVHECGVCILPVHGLWMCVHVETCVHMNVCVLVHPCAFVCMCTCALCYIHVQMPSGHAVWGFPTSFPNFSVSVSSPTLPARLTHSLTASFPSSLQLQ